MDGNKLKQIFGSLYNHINNLVGVGKLGPKALGCVCLIAKESTVLKGAMIGDILQNTSYHGHGHKELVLCPPDILFFGPMTWKHVTGSITKNDVIKEFLELAFN